MSQRYGAWRARVQRGVTALLLALALPTLVAAAAEPVPVRKVLVMGDSLSAAYGLAPSQGWVALTDQRLQARHPGWRIANASVSGETTAGGASRIAGELARHKPAVVVIELGANDGLRGLPLAQTRANLERMIVASKNAGARVLLLGMRIPPNYGPRYAEGFHALFGELATQTGVALVPFLLEGIATDPALMQTDGVHPTGAAQPLILANVLPVLAPLVRE